MTGLRSAAGSLGQARGLPCPRARDSHSLPLSLEKLPLVDPQMGPVLKVFLVLGVDDLQGADIIGGLLTGHGAAVLAPGKLAGDFLDVLEGVV